jgi:hypothetical protein
VKAGRELPPLSAEGVVGAAFSVIHARLLEHHHPGSLTALLNPLMATVALPYRGHAAAARELQHPISQAAPDCLTADKSAHPPGRGASSPGRPGERSDPARFRPTQRTQMVLTAVAEQPGASNREVSDAAQVVDQGQISKLLARLEGLGLLQNKGGHTQGVPNAWFLTAHGKRVVQAGRPLRERPDCRPDARRVAR